MNQFLAEKRNVPGYVERVNEFNKAMKDETSNRATATRVLADLAYGFIIRNTSMSMPGKEWLDLLHTIVPVAYCSHVLLDKRWASFVEQCGLEQSYVASVFRQKQVPLFLKALEDL